MPIGRKKWLFMAAAGLVILLLALYFTAAHLANSQWAKNKAISEINQALGGTVHFERTSLVIFPRFCIRIHKITFNRPDTAAGTVKTVEICPQILTLIKGEFRIAYASLEEPDIIIAPPARKEAPFSPEIIRTKIIPVITEISSRSPGATLRIVNGKLNIQRAAGSSFIFSGINLALGINRGDIYLNLESAASPWGSLLVQGHFPYAGDKLAAKGLKAATGECSISGGDASLEWEQDVPILAADVDHAVIDLKCLQDWGIFRMVRKGLLKNINSIEGRVKLSNVQVNGPVLKPSEWSYSFSGDLDRVALHTGFVPQVIKLDTGRFSAAHDPEDAKESTFEIIGIQGNIGKSSFDNVSALLKGAGDGAYFQTEADSVVLSIDEIQKWRAFQEFRKKNLSFVSSLTGSANLEQLQAEGPVNNPARWKYTLSGNLENVVFDLSGAPYAFGVPQAEFELTGTPSEKVFAFAGVNGNFGSSSVSGMSGKFRTDGTPRLELTAGRSRLVLDELQEWEILNERLGPVTSVEGSVDLDSFRFTGVLTDSVTWIYAAGGTARNVTLETGDFPTSKLDGRFSLDQNTLSLNKARASLLDTNLSLTGQVRILENKFYTAALDISGNIGRGTLTWASQYQPIPDYVKVPSSISVVDSRLEWKSANQFSLRGLFTPEDGPRLVLDLARSPLTWNIRELRVKDEKTDARFSFRVSREGTDFSYSGDVHKTTVDSLIINELEENAFVSGNLQGHIPVKNPVLASVTGRVKAGDILIPLKNSAYRLKLDYLILKADPDNYLIESAGLTWGDQKLTTSGSIERKDEFMQVELNVLTNQIVYEKLEKMIAEMQSAESKDQDKSKPSGFWELPLRGIVKISADRFIISRFAAEPFSVDITLGPRLVRLDFTNAFICGMPLPGNIDITPVSNGMHFRSVVLNVDLAPVLACLMAQQTAASGTFDFNGEVTASGKLPETLTGEFTFTARRGVIYRARLLSSILEYLNITQIILGRLPTIGAEGLPYRLFSIKGRIKGQIIEIQEFEMRGPTLGLAGEGFIDLARNRVELTVLVSPLRTFDYLISRIPIVRYFFKGILAIPVGVYGDPSSPIIVPLDPSAVGSHLYSIMERIVKAPFKLFERKKK